MTLTILLAGSWLMLLAARDTPLGRLFHHWMVERPAAVLSGIRRQTLLTMGSLVLAAMMIWWTLGHEGMLVYGMALPELGAALAAIDLGIVFDVLVVAVAGAYTSGWRVLRAMAARPANRARARRARRIRPAAKRASNDDDPEWAVAA